MGHKNRKKTKTAEQKQQKQRRDQEREISKESSACKGKERCPTDKNLECGGHQVKSIEVLKESQSASEISNTRVEKNKNNSYGIGNETNNGKRGMKKQATKSRSTQVVTESKQNESHSVKSLLKNVMLNKFPDGASELPEDAASTIGDVEKMRPYFQVDPGSGKSRIAPSARRLSDGSTALQIAIKIKSSAAVKFLLENGADCSMVDYMGDNAIMIAIKEGDASVINKLWPYRSDLDINHANLFGFTALHLAAEKKWEGCVNFLLQNGANPNWTSKTGLTPLMSAAAKGDMKLVERLIKAGADILVADQDCNTCVTKAFMENKPEIVDFLLNNIPDKKKETYVQTLLDIVPTVPFTDEDLSSLEVKVFPLLEECTRHSSYRHSFYQKNIVNTVSIFMQNNMACIDVAIKASQLLFCIFFRFNTEHIEKGFVYQFLQSKGSDFILRMTKHYTEVWRIPEKQIILAFLPIIGLSEIPEGRAWLEKNYITVAEYLNFFDKDSLKVYMAPNPNYHWCLEADRFQAINKVWKRFFEVINGYEIEHKERNIIELLQEEEKEKQRKIKKVEKKKIKQKPEVHTVSTPTFPEKTAFETVFGEPLYQDCTPKSTHMHAAADLKLIAQMFGGQTTITSKTVKSETQEFDEVQSTTGTEDSEASSFSQELDQINVNSNSNTAGFSDMINIINKSEHLESEVKYTDWTTVHTKKQMNKEKDRYKVESLTCPAQTKQPITPKKLLKKRLPKQCKTPPNSVLAKSVTPPLATGIGSARWADVAKPLSKEDAGDQSQGSVHMESRIDTLANHDFPTLKSEQDTSCEMLNVSKSRPRKMTFHFHDSNHPALADVPESERTNKEAIGDMTGNKMTCLLNTGKDNDHLHNIQTEKELESHAGFQTNFDCKASKAIDQGSSKSPNEHHSCQRGQLEKSTACFDTNTDPFHMKCTKANLKSETIEISTHPYAELDLKENDEHFLIWKNQFESFESFQKIHENWRINDPFISLPPSPIARDLTPKKNAIDALFETKEEIPQLFEEDFGEKLSSNKPLSSGVKSLNKYKVQEKPVLETQSSDLVASDPAIIGYSENTYTNSEGKASGDLKEQEKCEIKNKQVEQRPTNHQQGDATLENNKTAPRFSDITFFRPISPIRNDVLEFGQRLLSNAHEKDPRIDTLTNCDVTRGRPETSKKAPENVEKKIADVSNFPGFHETTRLSSDFNKKDVSVFHKMQLLNLEQLKQYYRSYQKEIMNSASMESDKFIYYAQMAGLSQNQIEMFLNGQVNAEPDRNILCQYRQPYKCPLPYPAHRQNQSIQVNLQQSHNRASQTQVLNPNTMAQQTLYAVGNMQHKPFVLNQAVDASVKHRPQPVHQSVSSQPAQQAVQANAIQNNCRPPSWIPSAPPIMAGNNPLQTHLSVQQAMRREYERMAAETKLAPQDQKTSGDKAECGQPQVLATSESSLQNPNQVLQGSCTLNNFSNIRRIQAAQAAMTSSVRDKISEVYSAMIQTKVKSVRWRDKLAAIRQLPHERLLILGKIVVPRDERDRVYVAFHTTGPTVLGYLTDGTEVAVKLLDSSVKQFTTSELERLTTMDVSNYFIIKYKEFAFFNNCYYLAMELHEYTLPEYIRQLHENERIKKARMLFQFLRGLSRLHQQYLQVHGELRPDNIVIDLDGNVKVSGYGFSRNSDREAPFSEYCPEDQCWLSPEQLVHKQKTSFKSDIFTAGSIIYYILRGGRHPFGSNVPEIIQNISTVTFTLDPDLQEEAKDLLASMLSVNRTERPCISDALSHPLFWADEKRLRLISIVGSDIVWDLKQSWSDNNKKETMIDIISSVPCDQKLLKWMDFIDPHLLRDMSTYRQYKNTLVELVLFIHNYCNHTDKLTERSRGTVDEACSYFLNKFPILFMTVYKAIKKSGRKEKTCYKPFF